jgi:hypothetical protein
MYCLTDACALLLHLILSNHPISLEFFLINKFKQHKTYQNFSKKGETYLYRYITVVFDFGGCRMRSRRRPWVVIPKF